MSVLVKGMKMPENCRYCPMRHGDLQGTFICLETCHVILIQPGMKRPSWCPLVEVPTPHGRLVDADELYERFAELDAQALHQVGKLCDAHDSSYEWHRWSAILAERSAYKHDIYDAPTVLDKEDEDDEMES